MRVTIAKIFGRSPFRSLQEHMKRIGHCMKCLEKILSSLEDSSLEELESMTQELSQLKIEADISKNESINNLRKCCFLPINKGEFLAILRIQDMISTKPEEIGSLLTLCPAKECHNLQGLKPLFETNICAFWKARNLVKDLHELLESSFRGVTEMEKIFEASNAISMISNEGEKMKHSHLRQFFTGLATSPIPQHQFYIHVKLVDKINDISSISNELSNHIRMMLELK